MEKERPNAYDFRKASMKDLGLSRQGASGNGVRGDVSNWSFLRGLGKVRT